MIEYVLLFGLGFLTAAFLVFLLAPSVHRRVVWYTEKRMRATMPLSPQEVRAQKDMVRAVYAAENARTTQELTREREKSLSLKLERDTLAEEASRLAADVGTVEAQVASMSLDAAELRSRIRKDENLVNQLRTSLQRSEEALAVARTDAQPLRERINKLTLQVNEMKVELATRETQLAHMTDKVDSLTRERDGLEERAKMAEAELEKAKAELAGLQVYQPTDDEADVEVSAETPADQKMLVGELAEEVRKRASVLSQNLSDSAARDTNDDELREEISEVAARLIALTALREGRKSPILPLLSQTTPREAGSRTNLAQKAAAILADAERAPGASS